MNSPGPQSMTGFGRHASQTETWRQTWEVRTVNSRYLEVKWRIPVYCRRLERDWEKLVRSRLNRGRADISLDLRLFAPEAVSPELDTAQALGMLQQMQKLADTLDAPYRPDFNLLLHVPFLWGEPSVDLTEPVIHALRNGLLQALDDVRKARIREGLALTQDISTRLTRMTELLDQIRSMAKDLAPKRMAGLREKVNALLLAHEIQVDDARLLQELALLSDRLDVSEELTRLGEHLREAHRILNTMSDPGRRLDFFFQECLREITTCGNKTQDAPVSRLVVEFKTELEKCREQVQNLE